MKTPRDDEQRERGSAALELVMTVPLVLIIAAMCLDLVVYIQYATKADSASTAAGLYLMNHPDESDQLNNVVDYLKTSYPELGFDTGKATVNITTTTRYSTNYEYRIYDENELTSIEAKNTYDRFQVTVSATGSWPALASLIGDEHGCFTVQATKTGNADRTDGASW